MKIERVDLIHIAVPLIHPFRTSFGEISKQDSVIVRVHGDGLIGYGEVSPGFRPIYSYETVETVWHILRDFIAPAILHKQVASTEDLFNELAFIRGHNIAKAGVEIAFWNLLARREGKPLGKLLGGVKTKVPAGVSIGIQRSISELVDRIENFLDEGYQRIKIKIEPGWDINVVEQVRDKFPDIVLMVGCQCGIYFGRRGKVQKAG